LDWLSSAGTVWEVDPAPLQEFLEQTIRTKQPKRSRQIRCVSTKSCLILAAAFLIACVSLFPAPASPQGASESGISVETSQQLFAVMCALDASGFDANSSAFTRFPERADLHRRLAKQEGPATDALRQFYHDHALKDPSEMLSRYISFGLVVGPPPRFVYQLEHELLPPDVLTLEGFDAILSNFYKEARLEREWQLESKEYEQEVDRYEPSVRRALFVVAGYLRELMAPGHGRTFTVFVEPLAGGRTNFRNYGEHYSIVVGSESQIPIDDIRHAYLHFLIDPLVLTSRKEIDKDRELLEIAAKAPLLPVEYREEFFGLFDECAVKAVELRLRKLPPPELEAAIAEDDRDGLILVRPIVAQLKIFEKQGPAMHYYFPDLVKGIDVEEEKERLKAIKFVSAQSEKPQPEKSPAATQQSDLEKELAAGDQQIAAQNGPAAQSIFEGILEKHPGLPRAKYGLAMACVLEGKATQAQRLFEEIVADASGPGAPPSDPASLAWAHVYLGRIHDLQGDRDLALTDYDAALAVSGAPEAARAAAQRGQAAPYNSSGGSRNSRSDKP
jgi:tetratricopeptide (TPR) repeat protein